MKFGKRSDSDAGRRARRRPTRPPATVARRPRRRRSRPLAAGRRPRRRAGRRARGRPARRAGEELPVVHAEPVVEGEAYEVFADEPRRDADGPPARARAAARADAVPGRRAARLGRHARPRAGARDDARRQRRGVRLRARGQPRPVGAVLAGARDGARQRASRARRRRRVRRWPAGRHDPSAPWQLRAPPTTWPRRSRRSASAPRCSSARRSSSPRPRSPRRSPSSCAGSSSASRPGIFVVDRPAVPPARHGLAGLVRAAGRQQLSFFWGFFVVAGLLFVLGGVAGYLAAKFFKAEHAAGARRWRSTRRARSSGRLSRARRRR